MNFALNIICRNDILEEKAGAVNDLLVRLGIKAEAIPELYWKDPRLSQIAFGTELENPDFNIIKEHLSHIAGTEVSLSVSLDEWEFSHYVSIEKLVSGENTAFIVCNVF